MAKPLVAIIGRPNVGKSMLFNKLTGQRTSIVEDTPGVTRDRIYGDCEWCGRTFSLVDTGGIEPGTDSDMLKFMRRQAEIGIELADAIIMVTDVRSGVTAARPAACPTQSTASGRSRSSACTTVSPAAENTVGTSSFSTSQTPIFSGRASTASRAALTVSPPKGSNAVISSRIPFPPFC